MNTLLRALALASVSASSPVLAVDVAINIPLGQPGYYGQIQLGDNYPRPQLLLSTPTLAIGDLRDNTSRPLYLHVPPGHARNWSTHCARYNACNQPAYFVKDAWYRDVYAPRYREHEAHRKASRHRHDDDHDHRHGGKHDGKGEHKAAHGKHGQGHDDHRGHRDRD